MFLPWTQKFIWSRSEVLWNLKIIHKTSLIEIQAWFTLNRIAFPIVALWLIKLYLKMCKIKAFTVRLVWIECGDNWKISRQSGEINRQLNEIIFCLNNFNWTTNRRETCPLSFTVHNGLILTVLTVQWFQLYRWILFVFGRLHFCCDATHRNNVMRSQSMLGCFALDIHKMSFW